MRLFAILATVSAVIAIPLPEEQPQPVPEDTLRGATWENMPIYQGGRQDPQGDPSEPGVQGGHHDPEVDSSGYGGLDWPPGGKWPAYPSDYPGTSTQGTTQQSSFEDFLDDPAGSFFGGLQQGANTATDFLGNSAKALGLGGLVTGAAALGSGAGTFKNPLGVGSDTGFAGGN